LYKSNIFVQEYGFQSECRIARMYKTDTFIVHWVKIDLEKIIGKYSLSGFANMLTRIFFTSLTKSSFIDWSIESYHKHAGTNISLLLYIPWFVAS
jgi:hypothetical protein